MNCNGRVRQATRNNKTPQKQKPPDGGMFVGLARYLIPTWSSKYPLLLHKIG